MNSVELHALKVEAGYIGESHGLTPITRRYTQILPASAKLGNKFEEFSDRG